MDTASSVTNTSRLLADTFNPGPAAQMYGSLAAVLAGFALAGLVLYLERQWPRSKRGDAAATAAAPAAKSRKSAARSSAPTYDDAEAGQAVDSRAGHITPVVIVKTLFFAMSALVICAFLYGRLAGEDEATGGVLLALVAYGTVLGPSVLSLFYALSLVMLTHEFTREAAWRTRWVIVAVGPAVVLSFLAGISGDAWARRCADCAIPAPRSWGFALISVFVLFGLWMTSSRARRIRPFKHVNVDKLVKSLNHGADRLTTLSNRPRVPRFLRIRSTPTLRSPGWARSLPLCRPAYWLLTRKGVQESAGVFRRRPDLPAFMTLVLAAVVGVFSLWVREIPTDFEPSRSLTGGVFILTVLVMVVFAFATGSVLDDEPNPRSDPPTSPN